MKYHGHGIMICQYRHASGRLSAPYAKVRGAHFTGELIPLYGGRFAALLYACRIIIQRERTP